MQQERQSDFDSDTLSSKRFAELMDLIETGTVSGKMAKQVLEKLLTTDQSAADIVSQLGGAQISDESELENVVIAILKANMDVVKKIKAGKTQWLIF